MRISPNTSLNEKLCFIFLLQYEERLIQRRMEAKKTGKKHKLNRDFMKDGHFSSQKKGMLNVDTTEFYSDLLGGHERNGAGGKGSITAGTSGSTSFSRSKRAVDENAKYVSSAKRKRIAKTSVSKASAGKKPRMREAKADKKNDAKTVKKLKENEGIGRNYDDCKQNASAEKASSGENVDVNSVSRSVVEVSKESNVASSSVK